MNHKNNALVYNKQVEITPPSTLDKTAHTERLKEALAADIPFGLYKKSVVASQCVDAAIGRFSNLERLIALNEQQLLGVAIDVGSTNICASLFDLETGEKQAYGEIPNSQLEYGSDILTRMFHAMTKESDALHRCLINDINTLVSFFGIKTSNIMAMTVTSNTVMTHFLLDLPVNTLPVSPYVPVVHSPGFISPLDLGLNMSPDGLLYVFPNVGSYVGGDTVAGILSTAMYKSDGVCMLIDAGTNVEVALGNMEWILVGAGAAGPAYDEGILSIGMGARAGAIYDVRIDKNSLFPTLLTIEDVAPKGVCGSGLISFVSEAFKCGIINNKGFFVEGKKGVISTEKGPAFSLYTSSDKEYIIYEYEIENFMSSKAAMLTMVKVMAASVGMEAEEIEKITITGALGGGIVLDDARTIGLLPHLSDDTYKSVKNTALKGAEMLLLDYELFPHIEQITNMLTYKEMNEDQLFMNEFTAGKFIP